MSKRIVLASSDSNLKPKSANWPFCFSSDENFQKAVTENDRVIVDCFATWCGPCKAITPILEKHSEDAAFKDRVHFVKFDVDELPAVTQALGVRAMPTFFFFKDGKKVDEMVGANPPALLEALKKLAA
ncbi:Thioredoxin [Metarhizium rileyi]|uniref:Thioredoxin n=1 Tax=Metarhizium rileyi (strain RCEF 4871) TaxID=1649241 RepID=A0A167HXP3_METRR|nr:Thioredoxin [Metarhizium rileyi RCEF 4871]